MTCSNPIVVGEGEGYVDTGHGHIAINASYDTPAIDVTVITAPVGQTFRTNRPDPTDPNCIAWMNTKHVEPGDPDDLR